MIHTRILLALPVAGCAISTSDLRVEFQADGRDAQLSFSAFFYEDDDNLTLASIGDGDRVTATFRDAEITLGGKFRAVVRAELEVQEPILADELIVFTLHRDGEPPRVSTVPMPARPDVVAFPIFVPRSTDLTFSWAPITDDPMLWMITSTPCALGAGEQIPPASSSVTIPANTLGEVFESTCTTELELWRLREGDLDPAFARGSVFFRWRQILAFASTP